MKLAFGWMVFLVPLAIASPPLYPDKANLLVYRDTGGRLRPVTSSETWSCRRTHILANMQEVMGPLPDSTQKVPLAVQVTEEFRSPRFIRRKLSFAVEANDRVPAYLFLPLERSGKLPAVLCLHQTVPIGKAEPAGLGGSPNLHYAQELAELGFVTLAPDYPSFGDYPYDFAKSPFASGSMKAVWNNMRAIDHLQSLPEVDADRIGIIGHSLGGHNAMFTVAFDSRIRAIVSSCGFTSFPKYYGGKLRGWTSPRYMPRIATRFELVPERVPFDFAEVVAAFAPRAFLAIAPTHDDNFEVSGVRDVIAAARPVYALLKAQNELAANYPDCGHDFPPDARKIAYAWLEKWLKSPR
jgi:dipeptidyl aminopeptidase/acylaminoacyl peptidase